MNSSTIYTRDLDNISSFSCASKQTATNNNVTINSTTSFKNYPCIIAINEYRNRQEIGLVTVTIVDLSVVMCQYADPISSKYNKTLTFLREHHTDEIIYPNNLEGFPLVIELRKNGLNVKPYDKKHFNFNEGARILNNYRENNPNNVLAVTALAANFHYLTNIKKLITEGLKFRFNIEPDRGNIVLNSDCKKLIFSQGGLFEVVNKCKTPQGARLLKTTMASPPSLANSTGENKIKVYIEQTKEATDRSQVENILSFYSDMEKVVLYFLFPIRLDKPNCAKHDIINVLTLLNKLSEVDILDSTLIASGLEGFPEEFIQEVTIIKTYIGDKINTARNIQPINVNENVFFVVKESKEEGDLLSKSRERLEQIENELKLIRNIKCSKEHRSGLLASRKRIKTEILLLSQLTIRNLRECLRNVVSGVGMGVVRRVGELDFLHAGYLYYKELAGHYRRDCGSNKKAQHVSFPRFTFAIGDNDQKLRIKQGMHPIMVSCNLNPIPNAFDLNSDDRGFILYGQNSSGKTTYMVQTVLLIVLAMIGYPVPAECFECSIDIRTVHTKFFNGEDTENKLSSFGQECKDVSEIVKNADESSIIFIDEFGKNTNINDGLGLSWALFEKFMKNKCFWVSSTHYKELKDIEFENRKVTVKSFDSKKGYRIGEKNYYYLQPGYGINMAQETGLDIEIVTGALNIRKKLDRHDK
eukprot:GAHX01000422.1.p1 GENE.GAHX01000422.1~~GAHX01000422.1.p1  ORF type:complete len:698 (+),score=128.44 GAHX01000422.1:95-2188(+)